MQTRIEELNERLYEAEAGRNNENQDALREQIKEELEKSEVSEGDLQNIAEQVASGMTSGIIDVDDDGNYRISWEIKINKFEN